MGLTDLFVMVFSNKKRKYVKLIYFLNIAPVVLFETRD